jgi:hypothetical protein
MQVYTVQIISNTQERLSFNTVSFNKNMQVYTVQIISNTQERFFLEFDHHLNFFASKLIFEELLLHI